MDYQKSPGGIWKRCGDLQPIFITQPAAGADFTYTLPASGVYLFKSLAFQLVSSATAANRVARVSFTHGGLMFCELTAALAHTASLTVRYSFFPGATLLTVVSTVLTGPAPTDFFLPGGTVIASVVGSLQATDQISAIGLFVEFFLFAGEY